LRSNGAFAYNARNSDNECYGIQGDATAFNSSKCPFYGARVHDYIYEAGVGGLHGTGGGLISTLDRFWCGQSELTREKYDPNVYFCQGGIKTPLCSGETYDANTMYSVSTQNLPFMKTMTGSPVGHQLSYPVAVIGTYCDPTTKKVRAKCLDVTGFTALNSAENGANGVTLPEGFEATYVTASNSVVTYDPATEFCRPTASSSSSAKVEVMPLCATSWTASNGRMYDGKDFFCAMPDNVVSRKCADEFYDDKVKFCFKDETPWKTYPYCTGGEIQFPAGSVPQLVTGSNTAGGSLTTYDPRDAFCEYRPNDTWNLLGALGLSQTFILPSEARSSKDLTYKVNMCQVRGVANSTKRAFNQDAFVGAYCTGNTENNGIMVCSNRFEGPVDEKRNPIAIGVTGSCSNPNAITKADCEKVGQVGYCDTDFNLNQTQCEASRSTWAPNPDRCLLGTATVSLNETNCTGAASLTTVAAHCEIGNTTVSVTEANCNGSASWTQEVPGFCDNFSYDNETDCNSNNGTWTPTVPGSCSIAGVASADCSGTANWISSSSVCKVGANTINVNQEDCSGSVSWRPGVGGTCSNSLYITQETCEAPKGEWKTGCSIAGVDNTECTSKRGTWTVDVDYRRGVNCGCVYGARTAISSNDPNVITGITEGKCGCAENSQYNVIQNRCVCSSGYTYDTETKTCSN